MKAISIEEFGGPEVLVVRDVERPRPGDNEVLIKLSFAGVNFLDTQMRDGTYTASKTYTAHLPMVLGFEGAGIVSETGKDVKNCKPGDRVAFCLNGSNYAEYATVPEYLVVQVPDSVPLKIAAGLMFQGLTSQYLVWSTAKLKPGDICLVHAAAGGVGQILVQLAKHRGATVIASVGSQKKADIATECGADHTVLYRETDFHDAVMKITNGNGVDVVFDSIGKDTIDRSIRSLRRRGLCVLYGGASGIVRQINPQDLADAGSVFLTRPHLAHHLVTAEETQERAKVLFDLIIAEKLKINIFKEFPLAEASEAHRVMERGETLGKMVLSINGSAD